jgi:hypothetical protein
MVPLDPAVVSVKVGEVVSRKTVLSTGGNAA